MSRKEVFIPQLIPPLLTLAKSAGALIMTHYRNGKVADRKADASPVTEADRAADRLIVAGLKSLTPSFLIVSEEGEKPDVSQAEYFWLVDPLDGTKSFVRGSGYFTVNMGLIHQPPSPLRGGPWCHAALVAASRAIEGDPATSAGYPPDLTLKGEGIPILGVVYDPAAEVMYWGSEGGAFRADAAREPRPIRVRAPAPGRLTALISHSHTNAATEEYLVRRGVSERIPCASSIKFCWLAEGNADLYPRFGPTMEWDTAAGHAILLAAGGHMTTPEGLPFEYGKTGFLNGSFVAGGQANQCV